MLLFAYKVISNFLFHIWALFTGVLSGKCYPPSWKPRMFSSQQELWLFERVQNGTWRRLRRGDLATLPRCIQPDAHLCPCGYEDPLHAWRHLPQSDVSRRAEELSEAAKESQPWGDQRPPLVGPGFQCGRLQDVCQRIGIRLRRRSVGGDLPTI